MGIDLRNRSSAGIAAIPLALSRWERRGAPIAKAQAASRHAGVSQRFFKGSARDLLAGAVEDATMWGYGRFNPIN